MSQSLPLFPLGSTLLPGQVLPVRVFEQRYRDLVDDLLATPPGPGGRGPRFGVVAIRQGHEVGVGQARALHDVGCVAEVLDVHRHEDGTSELVAVGRERFRLAGLDDGADTPYLTGLVEWLEEPLTPASPGLVRAVQDLLGRYGESLSEYVDPGEPHEGLNAPDDATLLSWLVAGAMVLHPHERQALLESPDAPHRLRLARVLLRRELLVLDVAPSVPASDLVLSPPDPR